MTEPVKKPEAVKENKKEGEAMPKVIWDDSKLRSTYANVCNVSSTREEMTLLFGTNQTWNVGQQELKVELTERIIINPYAAKRLAILLNNTVREYESRFGELKLDFGKKPAGN